MGDRRARVSSSYAKVTAGEQWVGRLHSEMEVDWMFTPQMAHRHRAHCGGQVRTQARVF